MTNIINSMTYSCHVTLDIMNKTVGGMTMIESRCGLLCSECNYREQMNCKGCIVIHKPFWGDACPVKSCCEAKGHSFCGQCKDFPCKLLHKFAYEMEESDNGKRIEQCRKWRKE